MPQAQHHLTEGQHHFERSENIIPHEADTNERCCASHKRCDAIIRKRMRINDVALCANKLTILRFCAIIVASTPQEVAGDVKGVSDHEDRYAYPLSARESLCLPRP